MSEPRCNGASSARCGAHLDVAVGEEVLDQGAVRTQHASVVGGEAEGQQILQGRVLAAFCLLLQNLLARGRVLRGVRFQLMTSNTFHHPKFETLQVQLLMPTTLLLLL